MFFTHADDEKCCPIIKVFTKLPSIPKKCSRSRDSIDKEGKDDPNKARRTSVVREIEIGRLVMVTAGSGHLDCELRTVNGRYTW